MSDFEDRLAALDPAARQPYQHRDLDSMIARITAEPTRARATWWHRFELTMASTLIAGSLVAAGAVAIFQSAAPVLPALALQQTVKSPSPSSAFATSQVKQGPLQVYEEFNFSVGAGLDTSAPTSPSYQLAIPSSGADEASRVAAVFGVSGTPVNTNGDGSDWTVTSPSGAALDYENTGVPQWYYSSTTPSIAPATASSTATGPLPSEHQVNSDAQRYLDELGFGYTLSAPSFGSSTTSSIATNGTSQVTSSTEDVTYTVLVSGTATGQEVDFSVDANNDVVYASGPAFHVDAPVDYPLQSPVDAVSALNAAQRAKYASTSSSDGSGSTSPNAGPPIVNATLNSDSLSLAEYQLVNGDIWFLPVYEYSGVVTSASGTPSNGTWSELAVDPSYVQIGSTNALSRGIFNF
jgi:hypothetical protein